MSGAVLGIFPDLSVPGGVQESGRAAWEAVARTTASRLFSYGPGTRGGPLAPGDVHARSRAEAIVLALRQNRPVDLTVIWHLSLLKLTPLFFRASSKRAVFLHGIEAWRPQDRLTRQLMRGVSLYLANSRFTWDRFVARHPWACGADHRIVPLGIDQPSRDVPRPDDAPIISMIGRMAVAEDYKGHREMIRAWPLVLAARTGAQLHIAGDGDLKHELEQTVRSAGLQDRVRFLGFVTENDKTALLSRSRALALPSRNEGFGLVYLEAMRLGRPCLVSTVDAGREVVRPPEAGLAADPGNSRCLADAILRLLTPGPEWDAMSRGARSLYETSFTKAKFQERLLAALEPFLPRDS